MFDFERCEGCTDEQKFKCDLFVRGFGYMQALDAELLAQRIEERRLDMDEAITRAGSLNEEEPGVGILISSIEFMDEEIGCSLGWSAIEATLRDSWKFYLDNPPDFKQLYSNFRTDYGLDD